MNSKFLWIKKQLKTIELKQNQNLKFFLNSTIFKLLKK